MNNLKLSEIIIDENIEDHLKDYQILVVSNENNYEFVYVGSPKIKKIVLLYSNYHLDFIKSLPAFFNEKKFCFLCLQPYQNELI